MSICCRIRCNRYVNLLPFDQLNSTHEAKATARDRLDPLLALSVIVNGRASRTDTRADRRIRYDPTVPHRRDQFILRDNPIALFQEIADQIEDLRLDRAWSPRREQLARLQHHFEWAKPVSHRNIIRYGRSDGSTAKKKSK